MPRPPKTLIEKAVKQTRLYMGSQGTDMRVQQKLYDRMARAIDTLSKKAGMDYTDVQIQVEREVYRRGVLRPQPGKDY